MTSHRAVLFDLDGTLIDSVGLIFASFRHTLQVHRGKAPPDDVWLAGLGTPLWKQLEAFAETPQEVDDMVATYREYNFANHDRMVRPYPGTRDALTTLKARGYRLAVVTSKSRRGTERGLQICALAEFFAIVVAVDDVENPKPHAEPVLKALDLLDADPENTVFVGDSPHDMAAGRAANVRRAAALWGPFPRSDLEPHSPEFWLEHPTEITTLAATT